MKNKVIACLLAGLTLINLVGCQDYETYKKAKELKIQLKEANSKIEDLEKGLENKQGKVVANSNSIEDLESSLKEANLRIDLLEGRFYTIKVIDIDGEILVDHKVAQTRYQNLFEAITNEEEIEVNYEEQQYGPYIYSINGSIQDPNWSLMININGEESWDAVKDIQPNIGDCIEFKNTCWAAIDYGFGTTMDEYDVLLDKTLYHYLKTTMKNTVENLKSYTGSTYWEMLMIDMYTRYGFDESVVKYNFTSELKDSIKNTDLTNLKDANIGKYYAHAKVLDMVNKDFKEIYSNYLSSYSTTFNSFVTPFVIFPAADLSITNNALFSLAASNVNGSTAYGPDANMWQVTSQALFANRTSSIDLKTYVKDWGNNSSNASVLLAASALKENVRNTEKFATFGDSKKDYLAYLFDTYYDNNLNLMKWKKDDTKETVSTNQIYAGLLAYKCAKSINFAIPANIFGNIIYK